jgi:hypothetical protein
MASEDGAFKLPQFNVIAAAARADRRLARIFAVFLRGAAPKCRARRRQRSSERRGVLGAREAPAALVEGA